MATVKREPYVKKENATAFERWEVPEVENACVKESYLKIRLPGESSQPVSIADLGHEAKEKEAAPEATEEAIDKIEVQEPAVSEETIAEIKQQAFDEGKKEGLEAGYQEGMEKALAEIEQIKSALENERQQVVQTLESTADPLARIDDEVEQELVKLAFIVAQSIAYRHVTTDAEEIITLVRESLKALPAQAAQVKVCLPPPAARLIEAALGDKKERRWQVLSDDNLGPGDCVVKSDISIVDNKMETRIRKALDVLTEDDDDDNDVSPEA